MGRKPDPQRKAEVLNAVVDYLFLHGLLDLTLRPLAEGLGTSARMLIYHFGSREQLLREALAEARRRQVAVLQAFLEAGGDEAAQFRRFWSWLSTPAAEPFTRLFFEAQLFSLRKEPEASHHLQETVLGWTRFVEELLLVRGAKPDRAAAFAAVAVAAVRGLLLDLLAGCDRARIEQGFADLQRLFEAEGRPWRQRNRAPSPAVLTVR